MLVSRAGASGRAGGGEPPLAVWRTSAVALFDRSPKTSAPKFPPAEIVGPPPSYDRNALYYIVDGHDWIYEPRESFAKVDIVKPGHFDAYRHEFRVGSRITCRLGDVADGIIEIELQIIECPRTDRLGHVMVSVKGRDGTFTPVRHDGTLDAEKEVA